MDTNHKTLSRSSRRKEAPIQYPEGVTENSPGLRPVAPKRPRDGGRVAGPYPGSTSHRDKFPLPARHERGEGQGEGSVSAALIPLATCARFPQHLRRNFPKCIRHRIAHRKVLIIHRFDQLRDCGQSSLTKAPQTLNGVPPQRGFQALVDADVVLHELHQYRHHQICIRPEIADGAHGNNGLAPRRRLSIGRYRQQSRQSFWPDVSQFCGSAPGNVRSPGICRHLEQRRYTGGRFRTKYLQPHPRGAGTLFISGARVQVYVQSPGEDRKPVDSRCVFVISPLQQPRQGVGPNLPDRLSLQLSPPPYVQIWLFIYEPLTQLLPLINRLLFPRPHQRRDDRHHRAHRHDQHNAPAPFHIRIVSQRLNTEN